MTLKKQMTMFEMPLGVLQGTWGGSDLGLASGEQPARQQGPLGLAGEWSGHIQLLHLSNVPGKALLAQVVACSHQMNSANAPSEFGSRLFPS